MQNKTKKLGKRPSWFSAPVLSAAAAVLVMVLALIYRPYISSESNLGIAPVQIAPATGEKAMYPGSEMSIPFSCKCQSVDRWMVIMTTTAPPDRNGTLTLEVEGADKKTMRTSAFKKIAGTYFIPLFLKRPFPCPATVTLHLTFQGEDSREPLMYFPQMTINKGTVFQIALQPERGQLAALPSNAVYPRSLTEYYASGSCSY
jgi:hypothetical protein